MGNPFFNHRRCPNCGNHLKHYYWYCGQCGNQDLIDWVKTAIVIMIFINIVVFAGLSIRGQFCRTPMTAGLWDGLAPQKLQCKK